MTGLRMSVTHHIVQWANAELDGTMRKQTPYSGKQVQWQSLPLAWVARCLPSRIAGKALHARVLVDACPQCSVEERWQAPLRALKQA